MATTEHDAVVRAMEATLRANWRNAGIRLSAVIRRAAGRKTGPTSPP